MHYKAIAYHEGWEDGRISGTISLTGTNLTFTSSEQTISLYKNELELDFGGTANRQIFIKSKDNKYAFSTADKSILAHPFFENNQGLQAQKRKAVSSFRKTKIFLAAGFLLFGIIIGVIIYNRSTIVRQMAEKVPYSLEKTIGKSYLTQLTLTGDIDSSSQALTILREKVALITNNIDSSYGFRVYISNDTTINAFALPGGIMVFNVGLLQKAESWEEVLGVAAHEVAHVTEKHHARGIFSRYGIWTLISIAIGDGSVLTDVITGFGANMEGLKYSRLYETESDTKGFEYLQMAKIDPSGLRIFFAKLSEEHKDDATSVIPQFLSTHPSNENRIENIKTMEDKAPKTEYIILSDYILFRNLLIDKNSEC